MKSITAAIAIISTSAAFADDQQLQNRLALARAQSAPSNAHGQTFGAYVSAK